MSLQRRQPHNAAKTKERIKIMTCNIDRQINNAKAALDRIKLERRAANKEHATVVSESTRKLSKGKFKLSNVGKRSRLHWYMDALRSGNSTASPYTWQKQAILCMALHNLSVKSHQQDLLEQLHEQIVSGMQQAGRETQAILKMQKDRILHALFDKAGSVEKICSEYEKKIAAQQLVIKHLRGVLPHKEDTSTKDKRVGEERDAIGFKGSFVKNIFGSVQKQNDNLKNIPLPAGEQSSFLAVFRKSENWSQRKVVARVA